jgi:hypothetical protein
MDLDDVGRSCGAVQAVHVLGEDDDTLDLVGQPGDHLVGAVRPCAPASFLDPGDVLPAERRITLHGLAREELLDRDAVLTGGALVESADAPVGRQPRVCADPRARDEERAPRGPEPGRRLLDEPGIQRLGRPGHHGAARAAISPGASARS